jgi:NADPH:quinone reductase-like Zn-dependent oxidoreductase
MSPIIDPGALLSKDGCYQESPRNSREADVRAIRLKDQGETPKLVEENVPRPQPGPDELLIRVCAAGITPTELLWYPTTHDKNGERRTCAIPAHEFSGVVAEAGKQVTGFKTGQEVYGMNDWFSEGALAEYCLTQPSCVALKPSRLTHAETASVPIGALTAWQGLFDRACLQAGERVLIHGGAGAVGVFAVQLARFRGAQVIATVSARNLDFVSHLGAEQVIDYRAVHFEERIATVDVVFDTVGGETFERSWKVLKPHGRMITIVGGDDIASEERKKQAFFIVEPNHQQLAEIGSLLEAGILQPVVDVVLTLNQATEAYTGKLNQRRGRGKLVAEVSPRENPHQPL